MSFQKYRIVTAAVVVGLAAALAACNQTAGGYGSAAPQVGLFVPSGYQTVTDPRGYTCGLDAHVCHYERRDRIPRMQ